MGMNLDKWSLYEFFFFIFSETDEFEMQLIEFHSSPI